MPIWKTTETGLQQISNTTLSQQDFLEEHLEDWIIANPDFLEEPLLIIGHQVLIPDIGDRIDVLALDRDGNSVIIELKRGQLADPVDMQALRYASYVSRWSFANFEQQAKEYYGATNDADFSLQDVFEQFCAEGDIEDVPTLNADQRIILVGSAIRDKLGSVALWLREHGIDIKAIEVQAYEEGCATFLQPRVIIPLPVDRFQSVGTGEASDVRSWITNGRRWHLEERCGPKASEMLVKLTDLIDETCVEADGPHWNQKFYVSYRVGNRIWLRITTQKTRLTLQVLTEAGTFSQAGLAQKLGICEFPLDSTLAEKLRLPSSVSIDEQNPWIWLSIKEDFDPNSPAFREFLREAQAAFPRA
ncbi:MAG: endonuclease NucS [Chloroflexota bacterium]|nr:endonuclease NucS [Chloroflexota bacterium]MDE2930060.1 endonuclease NucS [Chloroflexota bacterium]